jgi:hypothetical protein
VRSGSKGRARAVPVVVDADPQLRQHLRPVQRARSPSGPGRSGVVRIRHRRRPNGVQRRRGERLRRSGVVASLQALEHRRHAGRSRIRFQDALHSRHRPGSGWVVTMLGGFCPPSTTMFAPLIQDARSDKRKHATSAISSAVPRRPSGNSDRCHSANATRSAARRCSYTDPGNVTEPGLSAFTRMSFGPSSRASEPARWISAALAAP